MNIIGRLTRDAEVRTTSQDKQVVNFSIAITESYRNKQGEQIKQTIYFDCSYWISVKVAELLTKGTLVELFERISARAWTNTDVLPKAGLNLLTSRIKIHGGRQNFESIQPTQKVENNNIVTNNSEDDLSF
ncbi:single-stranded DNA-binding protein [Empedobacter sp. UBA7248]|uniref:single-stranded DNA-binding protein n=1 Tax=Empedobacter sp. UBA7248 TaxID=1946448 RepID=UPI0025B9C6CA|nr:single-stranded DNA-binding protein [Empedobacter sp. UBA7248]